MKPILLFLSLTFSFLISNCQDDYTRTMLEYQWNYKKELCQIIQKDTAFVRFFPITLAYKLQANVRKLDGEPTFMMPTSSGMKKEARKIAAVNFSIDGKAYTLFAYQLLSLKASAQYKDNFFIPFFDSTSGDESYGGGRYLDFVLSDIINDKLVVDFNKAYNPYCAFRTGYNCPIPPRENGLKVAIRAGEKNFGKANH